LWPKFIRGVLPKLTPVFTGSRRGGLPCNRFQILGVSQWQVNPIANALHGIFIGNFP
jgi:hypothetical protein